MDTAKVLNRCSFEAINDDSLLLALLKKRREKYKQETSHYDTLARSKDLILIGDTLFRNDFYVFLRFNPKFKFKDFVVPVLKTNQKAPINFSSHPIASKFKTKISNQYQEEKVNFGGHYIFTSWGCGSNCAQSAIVDVTNGHVYEGPVAGGVYEYYPNSRMLIVNSPEDPNGFYENCVYCFPEIYKWNGKRFIKIQTTKFKEN